MKELYNKLVDVELETSQYAQQGLVRNISDICQSMDSPYPLNEVQAVGELVLKQIRDTKKQLEIVIGEVERTIQDGKENR